MHPIPVIIVTGFLGCGKTSFLRRLLPVCGEEGRRPALIINEVGDVDVDGELLADLHAEQVKLIGGCVCCTLQSQLTQTIWNVLDTETYDLIIIECSGLSNPIDVVNALSAPALLTKIHVTNIIGILDAVRATKVLKSELAASQISASNRVILNKIDLLDPQERPQVLSLMNQFADKAVRYEASYGDISEDALREILAAPKTHSCNCGGDHVHHSDHHSHSLPMSFCTVAVNLPETLDKLNVQRIMSSLPQNVVRAKGFAFIDKEGWQVLHKVYDSTDIYPHTGPAPTVGAILVCIGPHLSVDDIRTNIILNSI